MHVYIIWEVGMEWVRRVNNKLAKQGYYFHDASRVATSGGGGVNLACRDVLYAKNQDIGIL